MRVLVFDTNALISAILTPQSVVAKALYVVSQPSASVNLAMSQATWQEFLEVVHRPKFNRYLSNDQRVSYVKEIEALACWPDSGESVLDCRDSKDNKFLEAALAGQAEMIITGDKDLLALAGRYPIVAPAKFWATHAGL